MAFFAFAGLVAFLIAAGGNAFAQINTGTGDYADDQGLPAEYIYDTTAGTRPEIDTGKGDFLDSGLPVRYIFRRGFGVWKGVNSTWSDTANWYNGVLPANIVGPKHLLIPATANNPVITVALGFSPASIKIESGGTLTVNGATVTVTGAVTVDGTLAVGTGGAVEAASVSASGAVNLSATGSLRADTVTFSAGTLTMSGTSLGQPAQLLPGGGGSVVVTLNGASNLSLSYAKVTSGQIDINSSGTVAIDRSTFDQPFANGQAFLAFDGYTGSSRLELESLYFFNTTAANFAGYNIKGHATKWVVIYMSGGPLAGEEYDDDAAGTVVWMMSPAKVEQIPSGGGSNIFGSVYKGMQSASAGDDFIVWSNSPHYGGLTLDKGVTLRRAVIRGDVSLTPASGTATLENVVVKGNVSGTNFVLNHCTVDGNITASGAGDQVKYTLYTGSITGSPTQTQNYQVADSSQVFFNPSASDYHLKMRVKGIINATVTGNIVDQIASGDPTLLDIEGNPRAYPKDIGADEADQWTNDFYWVVKNQGGATVANLGAINSMMMEYYHKIFWVCTGPRDGANAATDWPNSLVGISGSTGQIVAAINGANFAWTVGFPATAPFTFAGPVKYVYAFASTASGNYTLYVTFDSNKDGLGESISRIDVPWAYPALPNWAAATVLWTANFGRGPLSRVEFGALESSKYPILIVSDVTPGTAATTPAPAVQLESSATPTLYKLHPDDGGMWAASSKNTTYAWSESCGVVTLSSNATFGGFKSGEAAGDIARIDTGATLSVTQVVDWANGSGLALPPANKIFGSATAYAATDNDELRAFNVSNLGDVAGFGSGTLVDFGATGVVAADNEGVNTTVPGIGSYSNYMFGAIQYQNQDFVYKISPTDGSVDTDWTTATLPPVRGRLLTPMLIAPPKVIAVSKGGYVTGYAINNFSLATGDDGRAAIPGFPYMLPGGYPRALVWWDKYALVGCENGTITRLRWRP